MCLQQNIKLCDKYNSLGLHIHRFHQSSASPSKYITLREFIERERKKNDEKNQEASIKNTENKKGDQLYKIMAIHSCTTHGCAHIRHYYIYFKY